MFTGYLNGCSSSVENFNEFSSVMTLIVSAWFKRKLYREMVNTLICGYKDLYLECCLFYFLILFYWIFFCFFEIFSLFTFQMLSPFLISLWQPPALIPSPLPLLTNPPTLTSWFRHSPTLGHRAFTWSRVSIPTDDQLGHPLLHM